MSSWYHQRTLANTELIILPHTHSSLCVHISKAQTSHHSGSSQKCCFLLLPNFHIQVQGTPRPGYLLCWCSCACPHVIPHSISASPRLSDTPHSGQSALSSVQIWRCHAPGSGPPLHSSGICDNRCWQCLLVWSCTVCTLPAEHINLYLLWHYSIFFSGKTILLSQQHCYDSGWGMSSESPGITEEESCEAGKTVKSNDKASCRLDGKRELPFEGHWLTHPSVYPGGWKTLTLP